MKKGITSATPFLQINKKTSYRDYGTKSVANLMLFSKLQLFLDRFLSYPLDPDHTTSTFVYLTDTGVLPFRVLAINYTCIAHHT